MDTDFCPSCGVSLVGGLIFETGLRKYGNRKDALEYAECYGASETQGEWKREIAIYDRDLDRTVAYRCPDCGHIWDRD